MQLCDLPININIEDRRSDFDKYGALEYIHTLLDVYILEISLCKFTFSYEFCPYLRGKNV